MLCAMTTHLLGGQLLSDAAQLKDERGHCPGVQPVVIDQDGLDDLICAIQLLLSLQRATAT